MVVWGIFLSGLQVVVGCSVHRAANGAVQQGGRDFQCICRGKLLDGGGLSDLLPQLTTEPSQLRARHNT